MPHDGPKAGSKQATHLPSLSKRHELKRLSAKAEGRRHLVGESDFIRKSALIKKSLRPRAQWLHKRARPKSAARRACTCALADGGGKK